jgi:hypothetical protein
LPQQLFPARGEFLGGSAAIDGNFLDPPRDLPLETADALHEELVVEHADDAHELHSLEKRQILASDQGEHATSESEPAQLPVDERRLPVEFFFCRGLCGHLSPPLEYGFRILVTSRAELPLYIRHRP